MPSVLTMPKLSPTMEEGTIVKWHKKVGEAIQPGDLLIDVSTDKATVEHNALDEAFLRQVLIQEGESAQVNQPIAIVTETADESLEGFSIPKPAVEPKSQAENVVSDLKTAESTSPIKQTAGFPLPRFIPEAPLTDYVFEFPTQQVTKKVIASPLAKKLAKDKELDLTSVKGTGPNQRILARDLEKAQKNAIFYSGGRQEPSVPPGTYEEIPLSPIRKVIAQRLQDSKTFIPHFYVHQIIDAEPIAALREQLKVGDLKVTVNDFIIRATALALKEHPNVNCGFNSVNQTLIQFQTIDISVAVNMSEGLITPIIRHADYKSLLELSVEMRALSNKAREGKLMPQEFKGGSFTISNLGMFGITHFEAIINPPQACILAVGAIQDVPVLKEGKVVPGKTMHLTLSVDHRVVDGAIASLFLQTLKKLLEHPAILLT